MLKSKKLTLDDIHFSVRSERESITPEQSMKEASPEELKNFVDAVNETKKTATGNWWWCSVAVTGALKSTGFVDTVYLGCCSYKNKDEFTAEGGYYDDMCKDVLASIQKQLDEYVSEVNVLARLGLVKTE